MGDIFLTNYDTGDDIYIYTYITILYTIELLYKVYKTQQTRASSCIPNVLSSTVPPISTASSSSSGIARSPSTIVALRTTIMPTFWHFAKGLKASPPPIIRTFQVQKRIRKIYIDGKGTLPQNQVFFVQTRSSSLFQSQFRGNGRKLNQRSHPYSKQAAYDMGNNI